MALLTKNRTLNWTNLSGTDVEAARRHIRQYWPNLTRVHRKTKAGLIGLPKPYIVPSDEKDKQFKFDEMYYWDSYFICQALLDEEHKELVLGILANLEYLLDKYQIIPNASRAYFLSRSQPPFLSSLVLDIYRTYDMGVDWLGQHMKYAEQEYDQVWMGRSSPNWRQVEHGLSRYYDINLLHDLAEAESGWDMTPRFNRRALDYLPVDLNSLLYKYELDFAFTAEALGDSQLAKSWRAKADKRSETMNKLMYSRAKGLYFDYDYVKKRRGSVASLASYYPLWSGQATEQQAAALVRSLKRFEAKGGLATTDALPIGNYFPGSLPTQWAYPNGWAPLHLLVIRGLENYGYSDRAKSIALKWLKTNNDWFNNNGSFQEKYNVVSTHRPPAAGVYPNQTGFGWSNAVFEALCRQYLD